MLDKAVPKAARNVDIGIAVKDWVRGELQLRRRLEGNRKASLLSLGYKNKQSKRQV